MFVCLRIELFNSAMGGYLPRQRDAEDGVSKWRTTSPEMARACMEEEFRILDESNGQHGELTQAQKAEIEMAAARACLNSQFRDFVGSWGLRQYLIAPLAFLVAAGMVLTRDTPKWARRAAIVPAAASGVCLAMMLYRNYFGALGW